MTIRVGCSSAEGLCAWAIALALCGCAATESPTEKRRKADAGGSATSNGRNTEGDAGSSPECRGGEITPDDLAATPREFPMAEVLAIIADKGPVARDAAYERAVKDHEALIEVDSRLSSFWTITTTPNVGDQVELEIDGSTSDFERVARCVNEKWGAQLASEHEIGDSLFVYMRLDGVFNLDLLNLEYYRLPGVLQTTAVVAAPPPVVIDDTAFIQDVTRDGDVNTYSFRIIKSECSIELGIAVDVDGSTEIVEWYGVPDEAACQRPDAGM